MTELCQKDVLKAGYSGIDLIIQFAQGLYVLAPVNLEDIPCTSLKALVVPCVCGIHSTAS